MSSQNPLRRSDGNQVYVGFTGRMGTGKTSAASYLASKYGFQYIRYSQILQDWLRAAGCDKAGLQLLGWEIMGGGRQVELNARLLARLDRSRSGAIDGLRHPIDFESLSTALGCSFHLIFLEAQFLTRFQRLQSRFTDLRKFETADSHPVESHIEALKVFSRTTISNDGSLDNLHRKLDTSIKQAMLGEN